MSLEVIGKALEAAEAAEGDAAAKIIAFLGAMPLKFYTLAPPPPYVPHAGTPIFYVVDFLPLMHTIQMAEDNKHIARKPADDTDDQWR